MSGINLSQLKYTTTNNDDIVIGDPGNIAGNSTKFIVFQTTNIPGYASNPHLRCYKDGANWKFAFSTDGSTVSTFLTEGSNNNLGGSNTFNGSVIFTSNVTFSSTAVLAFQGNQLPLHAGQSGNSTNAGIVVQENSTITGFIKTTNARDGWAIKAPGSTATTTLVNTDSDAVFLVNTALTGATGTLGTTEYTDTAIDSSPKWASERIANPRHTNLRFYLDDVTSPNVTKQPVYRLPATAKVNGIYAYRNNTTAGSAADVTVTLKFGATTKTVTLLGLDAFKSFKSISTSGMPASFVSGTAVVLDSLTINTAGELKDITLDIDVIYDF